MNSAAGLPDPDRAVEAQDEDVLLTMCVWGEARGECDAAKLGVANVVMNRVRHGRWGKTVREVCLRRAAFSSFNPSDPNRAKLLVPLRYDVPAAWEACYRAAQQVLAAAQGVAKARGALDGVEAKALHALDGVEAKALHALDGVEAKALHALDGPDAPGRRNGAEVKVFGASTDNTGGATHYYDDSIAPPAWASFYPFTVKLGRLNFHRWTPQGDAQAKVRRAPDGAAGALAHRPEIAERRRRAA
jgi:spore germination cell wall hydrolase CwlJ-like protein